MRIDVKLFGPEAQAVGCRSLPVDVPGEEATCETLAAELAEVSPTLGELLPRCRFAVNHELAGAATVVRPGDEVALIGAVSGG